MSVMQNSFYVHTKYENIGEIYLYPIWEFLAITPFLIVGIREMVSITFTKLLLLILIRVD